MQENQVKAANREKATLMALHSRTGLWAVKPPNMNYHTHCQM